MCLGIQIKTWKESRRREGRHFLEIFKNREEPKIGAHTLSQPFILVAFLMLMLHHHIDCKL